MQRSRAMIGMPSCRRLSTLSAFIFSSAKFVENGSERFLSVTATCCCWPGTSYTVQDSHASWKVLELCL